MLWMCRKSSAQRVLLHGCMLAMAQRVVLFSFFHPLTPITWCLCQATASDQIIYHSCSEFFPKSAINYLRTLAPNTPIVFPVDHGDVKGRFSSCSLPRSARASATLCLHPCAWINNKAVALSSSLWFFYLLFFLAPEDSLPLAHISKLEPHDLLLSSKY